LSHHMEWPKGVAVPVGLYLLVALLTEGRRRLARVLLVLAPLFLAAVFLVHSRELLHLLMLGAATGAALALAGRPLRPMAVRLGLALAVALAFALVVRHQVMRVEDIAAFDADKMAVFKAANTRVWTSVHQALWGRPAYDQTYTILWMLPAYALCLVLAPLA